MVDIAMRIGTDGRVGGVAAVNKKCVSLVVPDNIGVGSSVRNFVYMLCDLTKFGAIVFVGFGVEEFVQLL